MSYFIPPDTPMRRIIEETALAANLTPEDILSRKRQRKYTRARQIAMLICRDYLEVTYPQIARVFKRDHTTVMYNIERATTYCTDKDWDAMKIIAKRAGVHPDGS